MKTGRSNDVSNNYTGWPKKATTNLSKNRIKDCQRDQISS